MMGLSCLHDEHGMEAGLLTLGAVVALTHIIVAFSYTSMASCLNPL